jgi:lysophospholipase L1-like esterase
MAGTVDTLLVVIEIVARVGFGLCDPPLLVPDSTMEYLFAPSQSCRQFGNDISFNRYSMRSPDFPEHKSSPDEFRVMVLGDSIVFAGTKVDQRDVATSRLQTSLANRLKRPVVVGNMSAGSWGPENMLAYVRRFGFFEADVMVVVVSSNDYCDRMVFQTPFDTDPNFPTRKPKLALWQIATRYLPRYVAIKRQSSELETPGAPTAPPDDVRVCLAALRELLELSKKNAPRVILAQHWGKPELDGHPWPGHDAIQQTAESVTGVELLQLGPYFKASISRGEQPYRDYDHPSATGQAVIAQAIEVQILKGETPSSRP